MRKIYLLIILLLASIGAKSQLIITQYYEGAGNDKWIEVTNVGPSSFDADVQDLYLVLFANALADAPSGATPTGSTKLTGVIASGQVLLFKNSASANPGYAVVEGGTNSGACNFNGDDLVILSSTNNSTAWENRTDVVGNGTPWGADKSFFRNSTILSGNADFTLGEWTEESIVSVDNAAESTSLRLGYHFYEAPCTPPTTSPSVLVFSNESVNSMDLTWTVGDGDSVLLVQKTGSAVDFTPSSGTSYNVGDVISGNTIVAKLLRSDISFPGTPVNITGLAENTTYHFAVYNFNTTDICYNTTAATGNNATLDATAPSFENTTPSASDILDTQFTLTVDINEPDSVYYIIETIAGAITPDSLQVKAGNNGDGSAAFIAGEINILDETIAGTVSITGLTAETGYRVYVVAEDVSGNLSSVDSLDVTTETLTSTASMPSTISAAASISSIENDAAIAASTDGALVWSIKLRDGDGTEDADTKPTIYEALNLTKGAANTVTDWSATIQQAALFRGTTKIASGVIATDGIVFTLDAAESVADNDSTEVSLLISLNTTVTDGQNFDFALAASDISVSSAASSSQINSAATTIESGAVAIEVVATGYDFVLSSNIEVNTPFSLEVTAVDANGNTDTAARSITLSESASGNLSSATGLAGKAMTNGVFEWTDLVYNVAEDISLDVTDGSLSGNSGTFTVNEPAILFISEVADPLTANGRFVEIYNAGVATVDLAAYGFYLAINFNGNTSVGQRTALTGSIASGDAYVIGGTNFNTAFDPIVADQVWGSISSNGDDVYSLWLGDPLDGGVLIDLYGVIGEQPSSGTSWNFGDKRARRRSSVTAPTTTFNSAEWDLTSADLADTDPGEFIFYTGTDITDFSITNQKSVTIYAANDSVAVVMPYGTSLTSLSPSITLSTGATVSPLSGVAQDFTSPVVYTVTAEDATTRDWTVRASVAQNDSTDFLTFTIPSQEGSSTINTTDHTVAVTMPYNTDRSALTPSFTLSTGATASPDTDVQQDFTGSVNYTVTAQDGVASQVWAVTVTNALNTENDILTYTVTGSDSVKIDDVAHTVSIYMPYNTDRSTLEVAYTLSGDATSDIAAGVTDITNPVNYTITAQDGTEQVWVVSALYSPNTATDFVSFSLAEQTGAATINTTDHTVAIEVLNGTDLTTLVATFTLSDGASAAVGATPQVSATTSNDFTNPVTYAITAEDGVTTQDWTVTVTEAAFVNTEANILTFVLDEQTGDATINLVDTTIVVEVAFGTDLATLTPEYTLSAGANANRVSNATVDFTTSPVIYTVTAQDGTTIKEWEVTVNVAAASTETDFLTFDIAEETGAATIDAGNHSITVEVAYPNDLTSLTPTYTLSNGATADIASGATVDFSGGAVNYTVTAQDGTTQQVWAVTVTEAPSNETAITAFSFAEQTGAATIDAGTQTISIEVANGTDVTALVATFTLSDGASAAIGATPQVSATTANDFTSDVTYTITAEDGTTTQDWTVSVTVEPAAAALIITGIIDGPLTGGTPKALELFATSDIADLSLYTVELYGNGGTTAGSTFALSGSATAGQYLYVASEAPNFLAYFGINADFESGVMSVNGDDVIELVYDGTTIDAIGEKGVDGTGMAWEYLDGWAYRNNNTDPSATFNAADWTFSGINATDGFTTNAGATNPWPLGTYSNAPDVTAPVFTVAPALVEAGGTTANFSFTADEAGTAYYVILPQADAVPSAAQVKAGQDAASGAAALSGSTAFTIDEELINVTGLTAATAYTLYIVAEDDDANLQASVAEVDFTTTASDVTAPSFSVAPAASAITFESADITGQIDETGTVYYVLVADGATEPTVAQILAGNNADGVAALLSGNTAIAANTTFSFALSGLTAETAYDVWVAAADDETVPNAQAAGTLVEFTTDTAPVTVSEDFNDCNAVSWTANSVIGDQVWTCETTLGVSGTGAYRMNGFSGGALDNEDWLISPQVNILAAASLSFAIETDFSGPGLQVFVSTDYIGTGNPNDATWTDLAPTMPASTSSDTDYETVNVDLSAYEGETIYLAFKYTSNPTDGAARYTLDDIVIDEAQSAADLTAPVFSSTPAISNINSTGADLTVNISEAGTVYYVVLADGATEPSAAQVKAGTDAANAAATLAGNNVVDATTDFVFALTGLANATAYDVYVIAQDDELTPNVQASPVLVEFTTDAEDVTAPEFTTNFPEIRDITASGATLAVALNELGNVYYVVLADGATAPSKAEVQAGTGAAAATPISAGNLTIETPDTEVTATLTGLTLNTSYDVYFLGLDNESTANVQDTTTLLSFTTLNVSSIVETFDNSDNSGSSYIDGTFLGQDGSTWTYTQARGDLAITDKSLTLGRNRTPNAELTSGTITTGVGTLSFDYKQAFSSNVNLEVLVNDVVVYTATSSSEVDVVKSSGDIAVNVNGDFVLKFRQLTDGGQVVIDNISWTVNSGPDETAPEFAATYPSISNINSTGADLSANINEIGTVYYVVLADGATAPSSAQVKAGTDASDVAANLAGNNTVEANTDFVFALTGLANTTAYDVYVVAEDDEETPNVQASPVLVEFTTDAEDLVAPIFAATYPLVREITPSAATLAAQMDEPGTVFYVVLADGATAPSVAQVMAGTDAADAANAFAGNIAMTTADTEFTAAISGLTLLTAYDVYVVAQDNEATPNVQAAVTKIDFTTTGAQAIADVRAQVDANGNPTVTGPVTVQGIVHGANINPGTDRFQYSLIDASGAITIRSGTSTPVLGFELVEGDEILIQGNVSSFNGLMQIEPTSVTRISQGNARVTPTVVTVLNEDSESALVTLENVSIADPSTWTGAADNTASFNVTVSVGGVDMTVRIDRNTELAKLTYAEVFGTATSGISITGLGGQFDNADPRDSGYQLLPYLASDIVAAEDVTAPVFTTGYPQMANIVDVTADLRVNMDEPGKAYYVVLADGATAPSVAEVKAGQQAGGTAATISGQITVTAANADFTAILSGLTAETAYDVYVMAEDNQATPNVQAAVTLVEFTTEAEIVVPEFAFTSASTTLAEAGGVVNVTIQLTNPATTTSLVEVVVSGTAVLDEDYEFINPVLVELGAGETEATLTFTLLDDEDVEEDETIILTLQNVTNAVLGTAITHTITITNDDEEVVDPINGVGPLLQVSKFKVYPNPSASYITLEQENGAFNVVEVINTLGEVVLSQQSEQVVSQTRLDVQGLKNGMYLIRVVNTHSDEQIVLRMMKE